MTLHACDLPGRHVYIEQVFDSAHPRTCEFDVMELAVIGEFVLVTCQNCLSEKENEVHIFDLMTNLWRDDITLDRAGRQICDDSLYPLQFHRFHVLTASLLGFVLNSNEASIHQLGEDRHFTLLYIIDFRMLWIHYDQMEVSDLFISPNVPHTLFFYSKESVIFHRNCIVEASVYDIDPDGSFSEPQIRHVRSVERIHIWELPYTISGRCEVFRYENNVYIVRKSDTVIFDCSTRQLSGILQIGDQLFSGEGNHDYRGRKSFTLQMMRYELSNAWVNKQLSSLIPSDIGNIQLEFDESSVIEWWRMKDSNGGIQPRWHFCLPHFAYLLDSYDAGFRLPSGDLLFVEDGSKSIHRIPARCFGRVKKLTELAKDTLLAVIPVGEREKINGSVENIDSLISQVYTNIYS